MYFFANWKMYLKRDEARALTKLMKAQTKLTRGLTAAVFPSALHFGEVSKLIKKSSVFLGAQDVGPDEYGAATGEASPRELKELGAKYALIGHSERRHLIGESDTLVARKLHAAVKSKLVPVLCVGETLAERKESRAKAVVERQLRSALERSKLTALVVAYEPVWAIGTGLAAQPEDVREMHAFIRSKLTMLLGPAGKTVAILYGGSVDPKNIFDFLVVPEVDGVLVGGASAKKDSLLGLLEAIKRTL